MRGTKGSSRDLAATQCWQRVRRRMAAEDRALQLSPGQGRQAERGGSCRHAKAAFGFNMRRQGSGWGSGGAGVGHRLPTGLKTSSRGHTWKVTKRPGLTAGDSPQAHHREEGALHCPATGPPAGLSHPSPPSPPTLQGSQAPTLGPKQSPADPSSRQEKCSATLYTLICTGL